VVHDGDAGAGPLDLGQLVGREDDGRAGRADVADDVEDADLGLDVDADRRLVEEEKVGPVEQADGRVMPPEKFLTGSLARPASSTSSRSSAARRLSSARGTS
jgi:hypothetical protein